MNFFWNFSFRNLYMKIFLFYTKSTRKLENTHIYICISVFFHNLTLSYVTSLTTSTMTTSTFKIFNDFFQKHDKKRKLYNNTNIIYIYIGIYRESERYILMTTTATKSHFNIFENKFLWQFFNSFYYYKLWYKIVNILFWRKRHQIWCL